MTYLNHLDQLILNSQNYNKNRYSIGSYYHFLNSGNRFFNNATFRAGLFYKVFKNKISDFLIEEYGVTVGSGFRYNDNANSVNLSFIFGERKYDIYGIENEKYIDFVLGIEVGEKWFNRK